MTLKVSIVNEIINNLIIIYPINLSRLWILSDIRVRLTSISASRSLANLALLINS